MLKGNICTVLLQKYCVIRFFIFEIQCTSSFYHVLDRWVTTQDLRHPLAKRTFTFLSEDYYLNKLIPDRLTIYILISPRVCTAFQLLLVLIFTLFRIWYSVSEYVLSGSPRAPGFPARSPMSANANTQLR